ncbi:MAG: AzlD domain-containing protein [Candidatus Pelagibacter sp.]|tara:strand:- start:231 stop:542 length:312 start_codon:yes stop_codon:yes gene_type:complete
MNWILILISGLITYLLRYSMISLIKKDMLSEKTRTLLGYVPSAVFPALIFPAVLIENTGSFVSYDDPKIIAILIAMLVGFFSRKIVATILSGLISYWIIIFLL